MIEFYKDKGKKHRWRIIAENGEIVGASSQGFASKQKAQENAHLVYDELFPVARERTMLLAEKRKAKSLKRK